MLEQSFFLFLSTPFKNTIHLFPLVFSVTTFPPYFYLF